RQQDRSLEMKLRGRELVGRRAGLFDLAHLREREVEDAPQILRCARGVDGFVSAVQISVVIRRDAVDESFLFADALEEARRHAAAEDRVEEGGGVALVALLRIAARSEAEVDLLELALLAEDDVLLGSRRVPFAAKGRAGGGR